MPADLQKSVKLPEVEEIISLCASMFQKLGYKGPKTSPYPGRQIVFDNQLFIRNSSLSLSVVVLPDPTSRTFNFEFRNLPGPPSAVSLQDRGVKSTSIQLVEGPDYKQLSLQVYFETPLNYQADNLVFRVRVEKTPTGPNLKTGFPWISPQTHMSGTAALDLTRQISTLYS